MRRAQIATLLSSTGILSLVRKTAHWSGVVCLNYHRIGSGADSAFDRGLWSASAEEFDAQLTFLKAHFDLISAEDLVGALSRGKGRHVLVTFDDGYLDNYTLAFPILQKHNVRATFFISTGFLDNPRLSWWDEIAWMVRTSTLREINCSPWLNARLVFDEPDRENTVRTLLRAYKSMSSRSAEDYLDDLAKATRTGRYPSAKRQAIWMSWDMVREMQASGMCIGGHTVNHPILARMPRGQQQQEISECGQRLAVELGKPMRYFSYPVGSPHAFNNDTRDCLRETGVEFAFSYYGGFCQFKNWDSYNIRRIAVETYVTLDWLKAMVTLPNFFSNQM